jgi:type IV pilus assembly protein PilW
MQRSIRRQAGLTLVELMVALGISLVLILAASTLYLSTRATQKAVDERGQVFETAHMAMRIIGRDLARAAFYPAINEEAGPLSNVRFTYTTAMKLIANNAPPLGLAYGVYGCEGAQVSSTFTGCAAAATRAGNSDGLVVSYFTSDAFSLDVGDRADCTRADAANDAARNGARVGVVVEKDKNDEDQEVSRQGEGAMGLAPAMPILVVNRYALRPYQYTTESGVSVDTLQLMCRGNGAAAAASLVTGIEQLGFRYGVFDDAETRAPSRYMTATEVNALAPLVVGEKSLTPWQRVVSVEVCVLARSFSNSDLASSGVTATDCDNQDYSAGRGVVVRKLVQVFGLRNRPSAEGGL